MSFKETYATLNELIGALHYRTSTKPVIRYRTEFRTFPYTASELHTQIIQWMEFLSALKIKKGDTILLWGHNCPEWVIAYLGSVAHGVIVVPIDATAQEDFIKKIQEEVAAKLLVKSRYLRTDLDIKTVIFEEAEYRIASFPARSTIPDALPEDIVEIVYTSGTTGTPKGVVLTHKNITANLNDLIKVMTLENYTTLSLLPLSHLFEQTINLLLPLATGSRIVYMKTLKPSAIFEVLHKERVNIVVLVPRLLEALKVAVEKYDTPWYRPLVKRKLWYLKYFVCGGAPLDPELEKFWKRMGYVVLQGYGLTETSPVISCNLPKNHKIGSVGKVLPSVEVNIIEGEICVKGDSVFKGYYNDEKKTKQSFTRFNEGSNLWFKTGDLGEWDSDEFLHIKGRKKDMIVTPEGLNVYPEDIEAVLNKIPAVKESCVLGMKQRSHEKVYAVALLKDKNTTPVELTQIMHQANAHLAPHQHIQDISVWPHENFPRTTTLKIKKNVVREYLETQKKTTHPLLEIITSKNKVHQVLAEVTKTPLSHIKPTANLTKDLKLSSIDRVELVARLEQVGNVDLDEDSITPETTVKDLENIIEDQKKSEAKLPYRKWIMSYPVRVMRYWKQTGALFPLLKLFCRVEVHGSEYLKNITTPVIFISNHQSYFDAPVILMKLPWWLRMKTCPAAWAEYFTGKTLREKFFKWLAYEFTSWCFGVYPFAQTKSFKKNMEYTGELLDKGYNILLFPEGARTTTGKIVPFKTGIGMMASHMKVPIVPIKIEGLFEILPRGAMWPKRGICKIIFKKPMTFSTESYVEITEKLEKVLKET